MRFTFTAIACTGLLACGDNLTTPEPDATPVPVSPMLTVSGAATTREGLPPVVVPAPGVAISLFKNGVDTPVATATSDALGNYMLQIPSNGQALDGYLLAQLAGYVDTYYYPPKPITSDLDAGINMLTSGQVDLLSGTLCASLQDPAKGLIAILVADGNKSPLSGAAITTDPEPLKYCYDSGGLPNKTAVATEGDGIAFALNLPEGVVTIKAESPDMTLSSHKVYVRAGVVTTTTVQP
jgi:hypothetical protein